MDLKKSETPIFELTKSMFLCVKNNCIQTVEINLIIMEQKHPLPPFTMETTLKKVQLAEDAWNSKDPERVALAYTVDTEWRNRTDFINGRDAVKEFLKGKW